MKTEKPVPSTGSIFEQTYDSTSCGRLKSATQSLSLSLHRVQIQTSILNHLACVIRVQLGRSLLQTEPNFITDTVVKLHHHPLNAILAYCFLTARTHNCGSCVQGSCVWTWPGGDTALLPERPDLKLLQQHPGAIQI